MIELRGVVLKILATPSGEKISREIPSAEITLEGIPGDAHFGATLATGSRHPEFPKGTRIRNHRQISILSAEDLDEVAQILCIPRIDVAWLAGNILVSGIQNLSVLPLGARFFFEGGVVLMCSGENNPCSTPARITQSNYPEIEGVERDFVKSAMHRRGIVAWVDFPGTLHSGEHFHVELPPSWNSAWKNADGR